MNDYLVRVASQDVKRKAAAVFVLIPKTETARVAGYYTLCSTSIELAQLPASLIKRLPRYPEVPAIHLVPKLRLGMPRSKLRFGDCVVVSQRDRRQWRLDKVAPGCGRRFVGEAELR
ncbi:MAG: hypothetical protein ACKV0T_27620 [Planctomycetales bacterium]